MTISLQSLNQKKAVKVEFSLPISGVSDELQTQALEKAKQAYVMTLLAAGELSSGKAASLLNLSRLDVIEQMNQQGISLFDDSMDIESLRQEVAQAGSAINKEIPH